MYEKHFSFKCKPFELVPNPDFLFQSSTHKKAITYLDYGIKEKIGFILLTGEIGSGKTTIIRNLIKNISSQIRLSRINNTKVSSEQLISMINEDFGLNVEGKSKTALLSQLNTFLINQYANNYQPILLIDEAQNLSPDLLEEIRLLSNLETDKAKLLQIILVGQPELNKSLMLPEMMQLRQRINISYHLNPLTLDETVRYIRHRLTVAGNAGVMNFEGNMAELIYKFSRGIPRLINILCDLALLAVFVEGGKEVGADVVREVIKDLESRDNWNIPDEGGAGQPDASPIGLESRSLAGDFALRIIKLENSIKEILEGNVALYEKMNRLEEALTRIETIQSDNSAADLLQRISRLEHVAAFDRQKAVDAIEGENEKSLGEQVESLRNILIGMNKKLRNR